MSVAHRQLKDTFKKVSLTGTENVITKKLIIKTADLSDKIYSVFLGIIHLVWTQHFRKTNISYPLIRYTYVCVSGGKK